MLNCYITFQIFALKPAVHQAFLTLVPSKVVRILKQKPYIIRQFSVSLVLLEARMIIRELGSLLFALLHFSKHDSSFFSSSFFLIPDDRKRLLDKIFPS